MFWKPEEIEFLINNYPTDISLIDISKKVNKSTKAIKHKAARLGISRKIIPHNKPKNNNHRNIYDKDYYKKHKETIYDKKKIRLKNRKKEFIDFLGGKCKICGYNKCIEAMDFHHDKGDKEECISKLIKNYSKQKALKEVKKCIILCSNCHREHHSMGA